MGELEQVIEKAMQSQADRRQIKQIISGTATNVDETTCDVLREGSPAILDVRLNAIDDNLQSFITIYPKAKTNVIVGIIENLKTEAVLLRCSEVDKVKLKIGEQTLLINKDGFVLNGGANDGIMKISSVVGWMQKVYADLQTLKASLNTWPVAGNGAPLALVFEPTVNNPVKSDFEDIKIKH